MYCLCLFLARVFLSFALEIDGAEQVFLSQDFFWGYSQQPPLYTWIQLGLTTVFGNNFFTAIGLRYLLIFGIFYIVYKLGERHYNNKLFAFLASASLLLFLQFSVESLRQTHSLLVTLSAGLLVFTIHKLVKQPTLINYLLLGFVLAIGVLSKYNFIVFALAIVISALFIESYRNHILTPKLIVSIAVLLVLITPNLYWLYLHFDAVQAETLVELQGVDERSYLSAVATGLLELMLKISSFSALFLVASIVLIRGRIPGFWKKPKSDFVKLVGGTICISIALLVVIIFLFKVTEMQERWLQPLLFLLTVYFFGVIDGSSNYSLGRFKKYGQVLLFTFGIILFYTTIDHTMGFKKRRITRPYDRFANYLLSETSIHSKDIDMIAANTLDLAGNMKFQLTEFDMELFQADCNSASEISFLEHSNKILLIWDEQNELKMLECLQSRRNGELRITEKDTVSFTYHYSKELVNTFSYAIVEVVN